MVCHRGAVVGMNAGRASADRIAAAAVLGGAVSHLVTIAFVLLWAPPERIDPPTLVFAAVFQAAVLALLVWLARSIWNGRRHLATLLVCLFFTMTAVGIYGGFGQFGLARGFAVPRWIGALMVLEAAAWVAASIAAGIALARRPGTPSRTDGAA